MNIHKDFALSESSAGGLDALEEELDLGTRSSCLCSHQLLTAISPQPLLEIT